MKKLNQDLIDNGANNFWCFLLFYTRLFYKRKKYLSWFENARYKSEKYSKSNKDYVFELSEIMEDFSANEKFFISKTVFLALCVPIILILIWYIAKMVRKKINKIT